MEVLSLLLFSLAAASAQYPPRNPGFRNPGFRNARTPLAASAARDRPFISIPIVLLPDGQQQVPRPKQTTYHYVGHALRNGQQRPSGGNRSPKQHGGPAVGKAAVNYQVSVPAPAQPPQQKRGEKPPKLSVSQLNNHLRVAYSSPSRNRGVQQHQKGDQQAQFARQQRGPLNQNHQRPTQQSATAHRQNVANFVNFATALGASVAAQQSHRPVALPPGVAFHNQNQNAKQQEVYAPQKPLIENHKQNGGVAYQHQVPSLAHTHGQSGQQNAGTQSSAYSSHQHAQYSANSQQQQPLASLYQQHQQASSQLQQQQQLAHQQQQQLAHQQQQQQVAHQQQQQLAHQQQQQQQVAHQQQQQVAHQQQAPESPQSHHQMQQQISIQNHQQLSSLQSQQPSPSSHSQQQSPSSQSHQQAPSSQFQQYGQTSSPHEQGASASGTYAPATNLRAQNQASASVPSQAYQGNAALQQSHASGLRPQASPQQNSVVYLANYNGQANQQSYPAAQPNQGADAYGEQPKPASQEQDPSSAPGANANANDAQASYAGHNQDAYPAAHMTINGNLHSSSGYPLDHIAELNSFALQSAHEGQAANPLSYFQYQTAQELPFSLETLLGQSQASFLSQSGTEQDPSALDQTYGVLPSSQDLYVSSGQPAFPSPQDDSPSTSSLPDAGLHQSYESYPDPQSGYASPSAGQLDQGGYLAATGSDKSYQNAQYSYLQNAQESSQVTTSNDGQTSQASSVGSGPLIYASSSAKQINYSPASPGTQQYSASGYPSPSGPTYVSFTTATAAGSGFKSDVVTPGSTYAKPSAAGVSKQQQQAESTSGGADGSEDSEFEEEEGDEEEASYKVVYIPLDILKNILSNSVESHQ